MDNGFFGFYRWDLEHSIWVVWINCMGVQVDSARFEYRKLLDAHLNKNAHVHWSKV